MTLRQITIEDSIGQMVEAQNGESNNVGQGLAGETVPIVVENVNNSVNVMVSMAASEIVTLPTLSAQTIQPIRGRVTRGSGALQKIPVPVKQSSQENQLSNKSSHQKPVKIKQIHHMTLKAMQRKKNLELANALQKATKAKPKTITKVKQTTKTQSNNALQNTQIKPQVDNNHNPQQKLQTIQDPNNTSTLQLIVKQKVKRGRKRKILLPNQQILQGNKLDLKEDRSYPSNLQSYQNYDKYYNMIMQQQKSMSVPLIFDKVNLEKEYYALVATLTQTRL